jgi:hypothetical protein
MSCVESAIRHSDEYVQMASIREGHGSTGAEMTGALLSFRR